MRRGTGCVIFFNDFCETPPWIQYVDTCSRRRRNEHHLIKLMYTTQRNVHLSASGHRKVRGVDRAARAAARHLQSGAARRVVGGAELPRAHPRLVSTACARARAMGCGLSTRALADQG